MHTVFLVFDQTNMLALAAAADPLRAANRQAGRMVCSWRFATPSEAPVALTNGLILPPDPISEIPACDVLVVVASFGLAAQTGPRLHASLRRLARDALVAGVDAGPWVLAEAGLLDGHQATVHWEDLDALAAAHPQVTVANARFICSGDRWTCGGASPALDMMLALLSERFDPHLAGRVAASLIHAPGQPMAPQQRAEPRLTHNATTSRAQALMEGALEEPLPIREIARRLGVGPRALQIQFRARLGISPQAHYLTLRLNEAYRLVTQTALPIQDIAMATGFASSASFARAFRAAFGKSATRMRMDGPD